MGALPMKALRAMSYGVVLIASGLIAGCANPTTAGTVNGGKYYAVSAKQAAFYRYGPQQGNGPDQKLAHDTLVTLIQPTFGYCKVQLMSGEQGYVATEDIYTESAEHVVDAHARQVGSAHISATRSTASPSAM